MIKRRGFLLLIMAIVIHLGTNPSSGGNPLNDNISAVIHVFIFLVVCMDVFCKLMIVYAFISLNI